MQNRIDLFLEGLQGKTAFVHKPENMRYLSGFLGEGALIVSQGRRAVVTDFRYVEAAHTQCPDWDILVVDKVNTQNVILSAEANRIGKPLLWEEDTLSLSEGKALGSLLKVETAPLSGLPEKLRIHKDEDELRFIQQAAVITDDAFDALCRHIKEGQTEKELSLFLFNEMVSRGASDTSFSTIVASGPNASLPHAIPTDRRVRQGDVITFDFGCKVGGYCSDFTRTVALGEIAPKLKEIYAITLEANLAVHEALKPGMTGCQMDSIARDIIYGAGYEGRFGHGLGHGVGLEIHEAPRLSQTCDTVLEEGMVVTDEPGIYLPGLGGVRIEDLCVLTKNGSHNFCRSTKELLIL